MGSLKIIFRLVLLSAFVSGYTHLYAKSAVPVKVMSYNIRTSFADDGENNWKFRKGNLISQILYHNPDVLGMQEVTPEQLKDLSVALTDYDWYGVGRDDGKQAGEYSCIFYKKDRFKKLDSGTFWLSENIAEPGKSWDAAYPRICSWIKLKDRQSGKTFYHFNTHFDHKGQTAREKSSLVIIDQIKKIASGLPVILTGDLNITESNQAYTNMINDTMLKDAFHTSETPNFGPSKTFSSFFVKNKLTNKIDYIFVNKNTRVLSHAVLTDQNEGIYYSDHLPVTAIVEINK